jgi:hypothetical protein
MKKLISSAVILGMFSFAIATPVLAAGINVGNPAIDRAVVDTYSNFTIIDTNNPVSADGWLTTFNYYAKNTNPFQFVLVDGSNVVKWVSPTVTPSAGIGAKTYNAVVAVESGWNLGVHFNSTGTIPFDWTGAPATYTPNNNGMPVVGNSLTVEGISNRVYSWNASGTEAETCSSISLVSSTSTQFQKLTTTNPAGSSNDALFTLGTSGNAVLTDSDGYPGAWDAAEADPDVVGAIWVNNTATAPTPGGLGDGQESSVDVWRLFSQSFTIPAGATVSSAMLHFTSDNSVEAYLDETSVGTSSDYTTVNNAALSVTPGAHELEFVVKNDAYGAINPTGLLYRAVVDYCVPNPAPECPAAPSVAGKLLKANNVKPKAVTNYISQVAHKMGPQTTFNTVAACNITAYRDAVNVYLDVTLGAY